MKQGAQNSFFSAQGSWILFKKYENVDITIFLWYLRFSKKCKPMSLAPEMWKDQLQRRQMHHTLQGLS